MLCSDQQHGAQQQSHGVDGEAVSSSSKSQLLSTPMLLQERIGNLGNTLARAKQN